MALSALNLIAQVKARCGRSGDTVLLTDTVVLAFLNDAQRNIVESVIDLQCMQMDSKDSLDISAGTMRYGITDITNTLIDDTNAIPAAIFNVIELDGNESTPLQFLPTDEFDLNYPDLTSTDYPASQPSVWTRRGDYVSGKIEIYPACTTDHDSNTIRVIGTWYAKDFSATTGTRASQLTNADNGLIFWGLKESWGIIGGEYGQVEVGKWEAKYQQWLEQYRDNNGTLHEWEANLYHTEIE